MLVAFPAGKRLLLEVAPGSVRLQRRLGVEHFGAKTAPVGLGLAAALLGANPEQAGAVASGVQELRFSGPVGE